MELLSGFGKRGVELGLLTKPSDILDTEYLSKYFVFQEFSPTLTAGKNSITFNGSELLKKGSEIQIECIDSSNNSLYIESVTKTSVVYKESSTYILSIYVYNENSNGSGKLILYGTSTNGATVKWIGNINIDKTKKNDSTVRFYNKPTLEVIPILSPVLASVESLNKTVEFSGSFYSFAVNPQKDTLGINKRNVDIDYRIYVKQISANTDSTGSFNDQIIGQTIQLSPSIIQEPYSYKNLNVNFTSSFLVKNVINNSTLILDNVVSYPDSKKNDVVINVTNGGFYINYPYVIYNTSSENENYLKTNTAEGVVEIKQSYADVIYRNLRTFSGFIARHKLYRKSLFSTGDFEVISDEPLTSYELLQDRLTTNKFYNKMGYFYNKTHIEKYWFSNSEKLQLTQSSAVLLNSVNICLSDSSYKCSDLNSLNNYIIVKDNSSTIDRNSTYYPFNEEEFNATSGSSYDCNFIELKRDVNYIISLNAILKKDSSTINEIDAGLEFYFTSSINEINNEQNASKQQNGLLKLGSVIAYEPIKEKVFNPINILFSVSNDLYGTLMIVPRKCLATISELSLRPYGDDGFSPDTLITRIPFPVNIANEKFEIKAELFDINSNLVYSDLRTITSFDPKGQSLSIYIPGFKDPSKTTFLSQSLEVSQSLYVGDGVYVTGSFVIKGPNVVFQHLEESSYKNERMLCWDKTTGMMKYTNLNDINPVGTEYINLSFYEKNSTLDTKHPFRVIPAVEGRNIFVPIVEPITAPPLETSIVETEVI